jgi:predicted amidohydrolase
MRVGFLQYDVAFGDLKANRSKIVSLIGDSKFDLLVLPELALTGYFMPSREQAMDLAEEFDKGESFDFFRELVAERNGAVVFGFPERAGEKVFNSAAMVCPDGKAFLYRKTHLFDFEKIWYDPGDTGFKVFEFRGVKVGIMICYDWFYPESARALMLKGAEIICHPANLVLPYCQDAMVTRCLENRVFGITSNRVGREEQGEVALQFTGRSQVLCCKGGRPLARVDATSQGLTLIDIDPAQARDKRVTPHNDLIADRRESFYR